MTQSCFILNSYWNELLKYLIMLMMRMIFMIWLSHLIGYIILFCLLCSTDKLPSKYTTLCLKEFLPQSPPFLCHLTRDHLFTFIIFSHPTCTSTHTDSNNLSPSLFFISLSYFSDLSLITFSYFSIISLSSHAGIAPSSFSIISIYRSNLYQDSPRLDNIGIWGANKPGSYWCPSFQWKVKRGIPSLL